MIDFICQLEWAMHRIPWLCIYLGTFGKMLPDEMRFLHWWTSCSRLTFSAVHNCAPLSSWRAWRAEKTKEGGIALFKFCLTTELAHVIQSHPISSPLGLRFTSLVSLDPRPFNSASDWAIPPVSPVVQRPIVNLSSLHKCEQILHYKFSFSLSAYAHRSSWRMD